MTGKVEDDETNLPSFSWRQKAQIPPPPGGVLFLYGWSVHCMLPSPGSSTTTRFSITMNENVGV